MPQLGLPHSFRTGRADKAELGCGMAKQGTDRASSTDETWLTDGRWGVVHFAPATDE